MRAMKNSEDWRDWKCEFQSRGEAVAFLLASLFGAVFLISFCEKTFFGIRVESGILILLSFGVFVVLVSGSDSRNELRNAGSEGNATDPDGNVVPTDLERAWLAFDMEDWPEALKLFERTVQADRLRGMELVRNESN